jgi:transposase
VLHADGYTLNSKASIRASGIVEAACWAQVRWKFFYVHAANGLDVAKEPLDRISTLYGVEIASSGATVQMSGVSNGKCNRVPSPTL